jgi:photosystem II stability/assembly factor-like uncharacterized protein
MEGQAMASTSAQCYVYAGLGGETVPGREVRTGLYRSLAGDGGWESITTGLPAEPQVRALAVHPTQPNVLLAGTQDGIYRSDNHGGHWERLSAPKPGLAVWSLRFHPRQPDVIFAGYEPYAVYRSDNGGTSWERLPMDVTFPDVTVRPVVTPKRILDIAIDPAYPTEIYAAVEVGGLLRSLNGGETWESISEGYYVNDDPVDMHGVAVSTAQPRTVFTISRIGMWRSPDRGEHWQHVQLEMLSPRGTYCRDILVAPDDPRTMYCAAGPAFRSEEGALFRSQDSGQTWSRLDLGSKPRSTMFAVDIDPRNSAHIYCTTSGGEVFYSRDKGLNWTVNPLLEGATQVYSMAVG